MAKFNTEILYLVKQVRKETDKVHEKEKLMKKYNGELVFMFEQVSKSSKKN